MEVIGQTWDNLKMDIVPVYECEECNLRTKYNSSECPRCVKEFVKHTHEEEAALGIL